MSLSGRREKSNSCFSSGSNFSLPCSCFSYMRFLFWKVAVFLLLLACALYLSRFSRPLSDSEASNHKHTHRFPYQLDKPHADNILRNPSMCVRIRISLLLLSFFLSCLCYFSLKQEQIKEIKSKLHYRHRLESIRVGMTKTRRFTSIPGGEGLS